ncbi:hypothetical protein [Kitasatospora sp. MAP5-34]|uniref:hypothetical protein n=1 Tax=Kitasatospora sp. MAP5-34 TaxID=3035102 RepID=UPI0024743627|nr:hypothetical protein [Kitasatospora sp. MAP5-34]MDH6580030.1 hypothetical protein [Kitasatospora sp. MAP5-34]
MTPELAHALEQMERYAAAVESDLANQAAGRLSAADSARMWALIVTAYAALEAIPVAALSNGPVANQKRTRTVKVPGGDEVVLDGW